MKCSIVSIALVLGCRSTALRIRRTLTHAALSAALAAKPEGAEADAPRRPHSRLLRRRRASKVAAPKIDELTVAWAVEVPQPPPNAPSPRVVADVGFFNCRSPGSAPPRVYAGVATLVARHGVHLALRSGRQQASAADSSKCTQTHPDSREQAGVPKGTRQTDAGVGEPDLRRHQARLVGLRARSVQGRTAPAAVMVFQDGAGAKDFVPVVFDNLIAKGDMPVTVGVFIQPGIFADRPVEPKLRVRHAVRSVRAVPAGRDPAGGRKDGEAPPRRRRAARSAAPSSGGICAFTVAWERPNEFSKVLSWIGSFTNLASGKTLREGGHNYPALIRETPKKPIRVFLQDGANDLDNTAGSWPLANQSMAKSLAFARYDYRFEYGQGFHNNRHGRALLPDSLRWLWRDTTPND